MTPEAPAAVLWGWRASLFVAALAYGTLAAMVVRGLVGGFGVRTADMVLVTVGTMAGMLAVLPMAALADLPEALWGHWIPERRWRRGRCPACAQVRSDPAPPTPGTATNPPCPECGAPFERPAAWAADWRALRHAAWVLVPAGVLGTAAGLTICARDEAAFRRFVEAARVQDDSLLERSRPRAWPASFAQLNWTAGRGFSGPPPFESPKVAD